ncbi:MAG: hypothetical protein ACLUSP_10670 [Christensenellales bacterium]
MDIESSYDTGLLYKNNTQLWGGDSGVIWVSKEQDPCTAGIFINICPKPEALQTPVLPRRTGRRRPCATTT